MDFQFTRTPTTGGRADSIHRYVTVSSQGSVGGLARVFTVRSTGSLGPVAPPRLTIPRPSSSLPTADAPTSPITPPPRSVNASAPFDTRAPLQQQQLQNQASQLTLPAVAPLPHGRPSFSEDPPNAHRVMMARPEDDTATYVEKKPAAEDTPRLKVSRLQFAMIVMGLCFAILLYALDQTIVATALSSIVDELSGQSLIPWIGSAYLLCSTSVTALYGKFADIFGRKWLFIFSLFIFVAGSVVCALAPSMTILIIGRGVAGIGGGGIWSLGIIIVSDITTLAERPKYQSIIGAFYGLASIVGPLTGGAFSDHLTWRWCFWINLPFGVISIIIMTCFLPNLKSEGSPMEKIARVDFLGSALVAAASACLITPLQLGGTTWKWTSPLCIGFFCLSFLLFVAFVVVENKFAREPIIPPRLFVNRSVYAMLFIALALGAAFFCIVYYISLFFQITFGHSATQAGLDTIPLVFTVVFFSIISGLLVSRTGHYVPFLYLGAIITGVGMALISTLTRDSPQILQVVYLLIAGIGAGCIMQIRILAIQASVPEDLTAIATAVQQFAYSLGGSLGVSITGAIFSNLLTSNLQGEPNIQALILNSNSSGSDSDVNLPQLREKLQALATQRNFSAPLDELIDAFTRSLQTSYRVSLVYPAIMLVAAFFVLNYMERSAVMKALDEQEVYVMDSLKGREKTVMGHSGSSVASSAVTLNSNSSSGNNYATAIPQQQFQQYDYSNGGTVGGASGQQFRPPQQPQYDHNNSGGGVVGSVSAPYQPSQPHRW